MKNLTKFINRFLIIMIVSVSIIMVVNIVLFIAYFSKYAVASAWSVARDVASVFEETDTEYTIPAEVYEMLAKDNAWAIYIDNDSMSVVWKTENLPLDVPLKYTISEISLISRGYLNSYSTFVAATETGLIVLGYPEEIYFTLQTPTWDYNFIKNIPANILFLIVVNSILIFIIYMCVSGQLIRSLKPIISGIISLPTGTINHVSERGILEDIAKSVNDTAEVINYQKNEIRKKETARANWISGVSHDIRTPLSMVMGYASQICDNQVSDISVKAQAKIILNQSFKIKTLIEDINLASQLEYEMHPLKIVNTKIAKLLRNYLADILNAYTDDRYSININISEGLEEICLKCDERLLERAINNIVQNSILHNSNGCDINISLDVFDNNIFIIISDNGIGLSDNKIEMLNINSHYMNSTDATLNLSHGLGFKIAKQIVTAHNGKIIIDKVNPNGLQTTFILPLENELM